MNRKRLYFLIILLIFLIGAISIYLIYSELNKNVIDRFERRINSELELSATDIKEFFKNTINLDLLASEPNVINWTKNGEKYLQNVVGEINDPYISITRIDENGFILYNYPHTSIAGKYVGDQPHNSYVLLEQKKYISNVFLSVQGFEAIVIANPIFDNKGNFKGIITMVFDYQFLKNRIFDRMKFGNETKLFIINEQKNLIATPFKENLGKNYNEIEDLGYCDTIYNSSDKFMKFAEVPKTLSSSGNGFFITEKVEFSKNQYWKIAFFIPSQSVSEIPDKFLSRFSFLFIILLLFVVSSTYFILEIDRRRKDEILERDKHFKLATYKTHNVIYQYNVETDSVKFTGDTLAVLGVEEANLINVKPDFWKNILVDQIKEYCISYFDIKRKEVENTYRIKKSNGEIIYLLDNYVLILDRKGKPVEKLGALRDITKQKEIEKELVKYQYYLEELVEERTAKLNELTKDLEIELEEKRQREEELIKAKEIAQKADKLKSEFLAQMSHEIRTPINTLVNFSGMVRMELEKQLSHDLEFALEAMNSAGERIVRTVELLLNMSELQIGSFEPHFKLWNLDEQILKKIALKFQSKADNKKIDLIYYSEIDQPLIKGDEYSLIQIFDNVIDNAIKYTNAGSVQIIISKTEENRIRVTIQDTGIGISDKYLPNMFTEFSQENQGYTRRFEGNGLGLALVKRYCDINNITINLETEVGKGTKFTFIFKA